MKYSLVVRAMISLLGVSLLAGSCDKEPSEGCGGEVQILDNTCNCKIGVGHASVIDIVSDDCGYNFLVNNLDFLAFYINKIRKDYSKEDMQKLVEIVEEQYPTNNDPLRYGKGNIHEGGIRVPCIIAWQGHIQAGTWSTEIIQSMDFYPNLLDVAGLKPKTGQVLDGVSLLDLWTSNQPLNREAIFSHFPHYTPVTNGVPTTAAWSGQWKLHRQYGEGPGNPCKERRY